MITSPGSNSSARRVMVELVGSPAGTMTQATRGAVSDDATSSSVETVLAPKAATAPRALSERSKPTTSCPFSIRRWLMLAPILPSPTMAIFIGFSSCRSRWERWLATGSGPRGGCPTALAPARPGTSACCLPVAQGVGLVSQGLHELVEGLGEGGHPLLLSHAGDIGEVDGIDRAPPLVAADPGG